MTTSLDATLASIEHIAIIAPRAGAVDYGLLDDLQRQWPAWRQRIDELLSALLDRIVAYAVVRTRSIAVTTISWTGDVVTIWSTGATPDLADLHLRHVQDSLVSRATLLRILSASLRVVIAVAAAYTNPLLTQSAIRAGWALVKELEQALMEPAQ